MLTIQIRPSLLTASQFGSQLWFRNRAGFQLTLPSWSYSSFNPKMDSLFCSHLASDSFLVIVSPLYSSIRVPGGISPRANPPVPWIGDGLNTIQSVSAITSADPLSGSLKSIVITKCLNCCADTHLAPRKRIRVGKLDRPQPKFHRHLGTIQFIPHNRKPRLSQMHA